MFGICFGESEAKSPPLVDTVETVETEDALSPLSEGVDEPGETLEDKVNGVKLVLEIVGAMGLSKVKDCVGSLCAVKVGEKEVHRTAVINNDSSPIWTVKSKSLCLLEMNETDSITIELLNHKRIGISPTIGSIKLDYGVLCKGTGERIEYGIQGTDMVMALRFRTASSLDVEYFNEAKALIVAGAETSTSGDVDFQHVKKRIVKKKSWNQGETKYKVQPGPDPDDPPKTEWMTKKEIQETAMKPSKHWAEVGTGTYGQVYLEVLGCDSLPNLDTDFLDGMTDCFVSIVFEDTMVRSNVIHDTLNPRWMPWSHRAFMFNIAHPSSILFLGVFDFDDMVGKGHDPISRLEIGLENFAQDTIYTLSYPLLQTGPFDEETKSTITVRLRVHWNDLSEVNMALSFVTPPRFFVNVKSEGSRKVLKYLTRGSVDMQEVSVQSVKSYVKELTNHWKSFCYLIDVIAEIILWRGRIKVKVSDGEAKSVWFPIHSMALFTAVLVGLGSPRFLPSIFLFAIAWALLFNNHHLASHPSPWHRAKSFTQFGVSDERVSISPGVGMEESKILLLLGEYKAERVMAFVYEFLMIGYELYNTYNKSIPVDISTVGSKENFLSAMYLNYLSYVHTLLRLMCKKVRLVKDFVNWKTHSTFKMTSVLLAAATTWLLFPYKSLVPFMLQVCLCMFFGPQLHLLDTMYIEKYYRTEEQLLIDGLPQDIDAMRSDIASRPNIFDWAVDTPWVRETLKFGRIVAEDTMKLRDFRSEKYGRFSEYTTRPSGFPSIPLSRSFAKPYVSEKDVPPESLTWSYIPGQKLEGSMIPRPKAWTAMSLSTN